MILVFKDNGHGIPPTLVDKVFSPFCTTKARGLGLGLPIVKRTLVDHNGRVEIRSDATGTTVTLQIPLRANGVGQP
jgi:nitrogen-specific signal transduction histidine kinase